MTTPSNIPKISNDDFIWSWKNSAEWASRATAAQNQLYETNFGKKYNVCMSDSECVDYILLSGFPRKEKLDWVAKFKQQYIGVHRKMAQRMCKKIKNRSETGAYLCINVVYVMAYLKEDVEIKVPVYYFFNKKGGTTYIDLEARTYSDWQEYLKDNKIEPSLCCYPILGHYGQPQEDGGNLTFDKNIQLALEIKESPTCGIAQTIGRWTKNALIVSSYVLMTASIVAGVGSSEAAKKFEKLQKFTKAMETAKPYIKNAQKYHQYANSTFTIVFSMLDIKDDLAHDDYGGLAAKISLIVASVLTIASETINKKLVKKGLGEKDLATATFDDLPSNIKLLLNIFSTVRCISSATSLITVLVTMLLKPKCSTSDYFNLASSLFTCYGNITSPKTAKEIFEQIQQKYIESEIAEKNATEVGVTAAGIGGTATGVGVSAYGTGNSFQADQSKHSYQSSSNKGPEFSKPEPDTASGSQNTNSNKDSDSFSFMKDCGVMGAQYMKEKFFSKESHAKPTTPSPADSTKSAESKNQDESKENNTEIPKQSSDAKPEESKHSKNRDSCSFHHNHAEKSQNNNPRFSFGISKTTERNSDFINKKFPTMNKEWHQHKITNDDIDKMVKKIIRDNNDVAGNAAYDYYSNHIALRSGHKNEFVLNKQLFRLITECNNVRELFCEMALTETTIDVKDKILLINGQLNIDGAAFAKVYKNDDVSSNVEERLLENKVDIDGVKISDREKLMANTKRFDEEKAKLDEEFKEMINEQKELFKNRRERKKRSSTLEEMKAYDLKVKKDLQEMHQDHHAAIEKLKNENFLYFKKNYRLTFEVDIEEFDKMMKSEDMTNFTIKTIQILQNLTLTEYHRLIKQFGKANKACKNDSIKAALLVVETLGFTNVDGIAACHQFVLNEAWIYVDIKKKKPNMKQAALISEFIHEFQNQSSKLIMELMQNFGEAINHIKNHLEMHETQETNFFSEIDFYNMDHKTAAAMAYTQANNCKKYKETRTMTKQQKIDNAIQYIKSFQINTKFKVISQDAKCYVPRSTEFK